MHTHKIVSRLTSWNKTDRLKGEIEKFTIFGNVNTFLTVISRHSRQKANKNQLIYLTFKEHSIQQYQNTYFPRTHETFTKIDHILGHMINLNKLKKLKSYKLYSWTIMEFRIKINNIRTEKPPNSTRFNNAILNNAWVTEVV